ncbi:MAG: hypothetical protein ABEI52_00675, partial [Halobacteriaceae archaeon]
SKTGVPKMVAVAGNDSFTTFRNENPQIKYAVVVDMVKERIMITHPLLADSTFTKLFFMDGRYMDGFEKFSDKRSFNGQRIKVWKVDWSALRNQTR